MVNYLMALLLFGFAVGNAHGVAFEDCVKPGAGSYELLSVDINECKYVPCKLKVGSLVNVTAVFDTKSNTFKTLNHDTHWIINNQKIKTKVTPESLEGPKYSYSAQIKVNNDLPPVRGDLFWQVVNNYNAIVLCFKVPVSMVYTR